MSKYPSKWEHVADVGVDSGHIMIVDPCYVLQEDKAQYKQLCDMLEQSKWPRTMEYQGGIVSSSGFGDGGYPVFAKITDFKEMGKRVTEIRILFEPLSTDDLKTKQVIEETGIDMGDWEQDG